MNTLNPAFAPLLAAGRQSGGDPDYGFLVCDIRPNADGTAMVDYGPHGFTVTEVGAGALTYDANGMIGDGTNYLEVDIGALVTLDDVEKMTIEASVTEAAGSSAACYFAFENNSAQWVLYAGNYPGGLVTYKSYSGNVANTSGAGAISNGDVFDVKVLVDKNKSLLLRDNAPSSYLGHDGYNDITFSLTGVQYLRIGTAAAPYNSGSRCNRVRIYRGILKHDIEVPTETFTSDGSTECLVSFDGANGATSATDESSNSHTLTFNGNAALTTSEKWAGTASLATGDHTASNSVSYTESAATGTSDETIEARLKIIDNNAGIYERSWAAQGVWTSTPRYALSYYQGAYRQLEYGTANGAIGSYPGNAPSENVFRHRVSQRENGVRIEWDEGKCVGFCADPYNYTRTERYIGGISAGAGFDGYVDEYRHSTVARYTPTRFRDEEIYDGPSSASGANYFAATTYIGDGASSRELNYATNMFDPTDGAILFSKQLTTTARNGRIYNTERGATKALTISSNAVEEDTTAFLELLSFDTDGVTIGSRTDINATSEKYVQEMLSCPLTQSVTWDNQTFDVRHNGKGFGYAIIDRSLGDASGAFHMDNYSFFGFTSAPLMLVKPITTADDWTMCHPDFAGAGAYTTFNGAGTIPSGPSIDYFGNNVSAFAPTATEAYIGAATQMGGAGGIGAEKIIVVWMGEISTDNDENYYKIGSVAHNGTASYVETGWPVGFAAMSYPGFLYWYACTPKNNDAEYRILSLANVGAANVNRFHPGPFGLGFGSAFVDVATIYYWMARGG